jgi:hypothetical protein
MHGGFTMVTGNTKRRLPSVALIVTMAVGLFWTWFSAMEFLGGITKSPPAMDEVVGGILQILTFGVPFFVIAWFLWSKPKIGAIILIAAGLVFGIWIGGSWNNMDRGIFDPVLWSFIGAPIILGAYTLISEMIKPRSQVSP